MFAYSVLNLLTLALHVAQQHVSVLILIEISNAWIKKSFPLRDDEPYR